MKKMVVGIDISKATIDAYIVNASDVHEMYHDSFLNKPFGFKQLLKWVNSKESKEVFYCIENTGYYSRSLCDFLKSNDLEFAQVNAAEIKMSMGIKREKSDPQLRLYYQRKVGEGKSKMSVLNAVRNKLIHRMFATVKRGTPYVIQAVH